MCTDRVVSVRAARCTRVSSTRQGGLTLIELVITMVILGVAVAGVLLTYTTAVRSSSDPVVRKQAMALAEAILEEVASKAYSDPDGAPAVEASRALWNDVDDYNGQTIAGNQPYPGGAVALPGLSAYQASIAVTNVNLSDGGGNAAAAKRIAVTVTGPDTTLTLVGYRTDI